MTEDRLRIKKLQNYFNGKAQFELGEITEFHRKFEAVVKLTTVSWRINPLVARRNFAARRQGILHFGQKRERVHLPEISSKMKSIYKKTGKEFPYRAVCIWNTKWLNDFMVLPPTSQICRIAIRFLILFQPKSSCY